MTSGSRCQGWAAVLRSVRRPSLEDAAAREMRRLRTQAAQTRPAAVDPQRSFASVDRNAGPCPRSRPLLKRPDRPGYPDGANIKIVPHSVIVVRNTEGRINALVNRAHKGPMICYQPSGHVSELTCPYLKSAGMPPCPRTLSGRRHSSVCRQNHSPETSVKTQRDPHTI